MEQLALTKSDIETAAQMIGCEPEVLEAVVSVQFPDPGFVEIRSGIFHPVVKFNRQRFSHFTEGKHNHRPSLSSPRAESTKQKKTKLAEIERYQEAFKLDADASKRATAWGKFQIEGVNHRLCGYSTIDAMIEQFARNGEAAQLGAWILWTKTQGLDADLKSKNWLNFSRYLNGLTEEEEKAAQYEAEYARLIKKRAETRKAEELAARAQADLAQDQIDCEALEMACSPEVLTVPTVEVFEDGSTSSFKLVRWLLGLAFIALAYGIWRNVPFVVCASTACAAFVVSIYVWLEFRLNQSV